METKKCPYCGGEIMLVAKKCKHCGKWLEEQPQSNEMSESTIQVVQDFEEDIKRTQKKKKILLISGGLITLGLLIWFICLIVASNKETEQEAAITERYWAMIDMVENSGRYKLLRADGEKLWYTPESVSGGDLMYGNIIVYDSKTDKVIEVDVNHTTIESIYVDDMVEHDGTITIIMSENRNSNGWTIGTYVWQYNCYSGIWTPLAKACSGAEFVNNRTAVKIRHADCINPNDYTYLQRYTYTYDTIQL